MGKPTGFLEIPRAENPLRDAQARLTDFADLHGRLSGEERACQAARCMSCGVPFCQSDYGCPLHNLIPEWNELIYRGEIRAAFDRLMKTAPFPEFTGRVCPALCEKACNLADEGVTNRDNELFLIEEGFRNGWVQPRTPKKRTGWCIAVIGSGPAGLAAADLLNRLGHTVTVFEQADRPGGLLTYGIPNMKLPKEVVARRIDLMQREGVTFRLGERADASLLPDYDAVILCGGSRQARRLNVPGEGAAGVAFAVDYLTEATAALLSHGVPRISAQGKRVIVVGGGDTGNDCVGTALRQGCQSVIQLELTAAPPQGRTAQNPWPTWPRVLRTDYGQQEAIAVQGEDPRRFRTTVQRILTDDAGRMTAVETVGVDDNFQPVPGSEQVVDCQLLLIAAGFVGCERATAADFSLTLNKRGVPETESAHRVKGKLFAAGDLRTGQSLVVRAIADGRAAAIEVDAFLKR